MPSYYPKKELRILEDEFATLEVRRRRIVESLLNYEFASQRAQEYARHGVGRRISTLARCIRNVFVLLPPNLETIPSMDETQDALIQLQSHIINVFGCVDNLAWMWVLETDHKAPDGKDLNRKQIGLRKRHVEVRGSLSKDFQAFLGSLEGWFTYLENYRDALAHRIPLYVPPFAIDPRNEARHQELERRKMAAMPERRRRTTSRLKKN
jgi:hypothetical protein